MIPKTMKAMVLTRFGDFDALEWHEDWPVPSPAAGEVLIEVGACGLNNTDVNTRSGWYAKSVTSGTTGGAYEEVTEGQGAWGGGSIFPRIQGADVCGRIVAVGAGVAEARIGERVLCDTWIRPAPGEAGATAGYIGSERDGGFADYTALPSENAIAIDSDLSDAELATFPCSYATAEGMLSRAGVGAGDRVLITGASGGVGSALVQLAKRRGAQVIALASEAKHDDLRPLGPDHLLGRGPEDLAGALEAATGAAKVDVVADIVGGDYFPTLIDCLDRGGRYVTSGAIAGPIVSLDLRTLHLQDLTFHGSTITSAQNFRDLVGYIERGEVRPVLAATYPLADLKAAQQAFIDKTHVGNIVVTP